MTAMLATVPIFAHQGGWDEILLIGAPMVVIAGLLILAKRRVDRLASGEPVDKESVDR